VGKSDAEIITALDAGIFSFNVESLQELQVIEQLASERNKQANIALRLNPDIAANTHAHITTGTKANKFGIRIEELLPALRQIKESA
ncbi:MAG TPA: diaminopimelate decarboxylase, partial [Bacteroidales bacterium]|nr:diaminopimelate decarboxylase [Bacteroidales bacterium]